MNKEQYFGTTESGEIAFNLEVFDRLYKGNIIITKRLTDKLIEKLIEHQDKIILHITCTGMGGTIIEPLVPSYEKTYEQTKKLIDNGFPVSHIVLRVDPVIPTKKGIDLACSVVDKFSDLEITRVRWSSLDMYKHVKDRFINNSIKLPYTTFNASDKDIESAHNSLLECCAKYGIELESCGEGKYPGTPCLSQKDVDILGLTNNIHLEGSAEQRKTCGCPANKKELLKVGKPHPCNNNCLYCYWKN